MLEALKAKVAEQAARLERDGGLPCVSSFLVGKLEAYKDVLRLIEELSPCERKACGYYTHYLAYGPADLTHDGFHEAERKCAYWQGRAEKWYEDHPEGDLPASIEAQCRRWEKAVRA